MTTRAPAKSRVREWTAGVLLTIYGTFVLFVVFWPTPVDRGLHSSIEKLLTILHRHGVPEWFGYSKLEFTANIGMFIPLGLLIALVLPARLWWVALVTCTGFSIVVEVMQGLFQAQRFASPLDVLANSIGGIIGTIVAVALRALVYARDQKVIARARFEIDRA